jgi:hypothetical protein
MVLEADTLKELFGNLESARSLAFSKLYAVERAIDHLNTDLYKLARVLDEVTKIFENNISHDITGFSNGKRTIMVEEEQINTKYGWVTYKRTIQGV